MVLDSFDPSSVAEDIRSNIAELVRTHNAEGVLMGLSGGVDSAALATLATQTLGADRVHAAFLYDCHTEADSYRKVDQMAEWLGISVAKVDIEPVMREQDIYGVWFLRPGRLIGLINRRLLDVAYRLLFRETPFQSTLRRGQFGRRWLQRFVYNRTIRHVEAAFNARHRYRRVWLEDEAASRRLLLLGAANRTEADVGWFVHGGIDGLPSDRQPLIGLYKTEIHLLADHLDLPENIRTQVPSPDMLHGVRDESAIGLRYSKIDRVLAGLERGWTDDQLRAAGATPREIRVVRQLNDLSAWKRESEGEDARPLPVPVG